MGDFVRPELVRLTLEGGAFVDIKKRLNHGEREDLFARWSPYVTDGAMQLERREVRTGKVLAYLVGWSLTAEDGSPVRYGLELPEGARLELLRSLDPDRFNDIHAAIDAHEVAEGARRDAEKKTRDGSPGAGLTSPSPSAVPGA